VGKNQYHIAFINWLPPYMFRCSNILLTPHLLAGKNSYYSLLLRIAQWKNHGGHSGRPWAILFTAQMMAGEDHLQLRRVRQHLCSVHTTGPRWGARCFFVGMGYPWDRLVNEDKLFGLCVCVFVFVRNDRLRADTKFLGNPGHQWKADMFKTMQQK